jgi:hypothetical protein
MNAGSVSMGPPYNFSKDKKYDSGSLHGIFQCKVSSSQLLKITVQAKLNGYRPSAAHKPPIGTYGTNDMSTDT